MRPLLQLWWDLWLERLDIGGQHARSMTGEVSSCLAPQRGERLVSWVSMKPPDPVVNDPPCNSACLLQPRCANRGTQKPGRSGNKTVNTNGGSFLQKMWKMWVRKLLTSCYHIL